MAARVRSATAPRANLRDQILDAAIRLLRDQGVKRLAQPQVARAAGIPQGHLTYYFPKKSDLMVAVARRTIEITAMELAAFFASDGWPGSDASLRSKACALTKFQVTDHERTRMLVGLLVEADEDPGLRKMLIDNVQLVRGLLARGLGRAEDDPDVEIAQATLWGLGLMHLLFRGSRPDDWADAHFARLPAWLESAPTPEGDPEAPASKRRRKT